MCIRDRWVGDVWDPRLDNFVPGEISGKPEAIVQWAVEEMKNTARAAEMCIRDRVDSDCLEKAWRDLMKVEKTKFS